MLCTTAAAAGITCLFCTQTTQQTANLLVPTLAHESFDAVISSSKHQLESGKNLHMDVLLATSAALLLNTHLFQTCPELHSDQPVPAGTACIDI